MALTSTRWFDAYRGCQHGVVEMLLLLLLLWFLQDDAGCARCKQVCFDYRGGETDEKQPAWFKVLMIYSVVPGTKDYEFIQEYKAHNERVKSECEKVCVDRGTCPPPPTAPPSPAVSTPLAASNESPVQPSPSSQG
jgi:hypothetical protein